MPTPSRSATRRIDSASSPYASATSIPARTTRSTLKPGLGPRVGDFWVGEHALALAVAWPLLIVAVFLPLSVRRFQRLSR